MSSPSPVRSRRSTETTSAFIWMLRRMSSASASLVTSVAAPGSAATILVIRSSEMKPALTTSASPEEISSGLAEVVKAGFISDERITRNVAADPGAATDVSSDALAELIRLSIQMKADVVSVDLRERTGEGEDIGRESLNYGHTLGH